MSWLSPYLNEEVFLVRDASQFEIRMLAQLSGDKLLCAQLNSGEDIHPQVAHTVFGWSLERSKEEKPRVIAKQLHFGIIFGLQPPAIYRKCRRLKVKTTLEEVRTAHGNYFNKYTGVKEFREYCIEYARENGRTIPNIFGMSRELYISNEREEGHAFWANQAVNTPVQGSAAQFLLLCLAIIKERSEKYALLRNNMRNEIHDSLVVTPKLKELVVADRLLEEVMERECVEEAAKRFGIKMKVPLASEAKIGFRFGTMVKYDRKKQNLETIVDSWCAQNVKVEKYFVEDPLRFVDLQRGEAV